MPLLAPAAAGGAVLLASNMPPEVVFDLARLALLVAGAYAFGRVLLRLVDALTGWPEDR